jgi:hypothetical protein
MKDHKLLAIEQLLSEADFQHLIKIGAPTDEYDHEAQYIYDLVKSTDSVADIQQKIWNVFYTAFCTGTSYKPDGIEHEFEMAYEKAVTHIGTVDNYLEIAQKIKLIFG